VHYAHLARGALVVLIAVAAAAFVGWLSHIAVLLATRRRPVPFLTKLQAGCRRPWTAVLFTTALVIATPLIGLTDTALEIVEHSLVFALVATSAWLITRILFVIEETAFRRLPIDVADNRRTRRIRTQIGLLRRLTAVTISVVALAAALMTISSLRTFGASLLASAGIVGVIAGLAAQTTLGNVFAGLQLAFSDSLRIDDVIVVEKEWGRVEEIRLTHIVLRLWDHRRLILPTTYFTNRPFQNWTQHEARVLAEVLVHIDYSASVAPLRSQTHEIIKQSPLWDQREWNLQVVDTTPTTKIIRVLASASDAPSAWDLRCYIREEIIEYLRVHDPGGLPPARVVLDPRH
jgi:small-conductance mechanosensitive channel